MKTIVHLSDLHFGKVDTAKINPLIKKIQEIKPDLIIVSGDLTQRATDTQYKAAKKFLSRLKFPVFVIPGNHDIPLYNIYRRLTSPFKKYSQFINSNLTPIYKDDKIAVVGINSVRKYRITSGKIGKEQISNAVKIFDGMDPNLTKIVVCHHPFEIPSTMKMKRHTHKVVANSKKAMKHFSEQKVDIFLSGHLHVTNVTDTANRYKIDGYRGLIVQAGTISKRLRNETVAFNVLNIKKPFINVQNYALDGLSLDFALSSTKDFRYVEDGWKEAIKL